MHIIPVASGKGGVGKSLFSANLGIALGQSGKKVVLADLDLGGSNLHLILGIRHAPLGIGTFLSDSKASFSDIIKKTDYKNVWFIPGDAEIPGMANVNIIQKRRLMKNLLSIDADYLILDLGAGTSHHTVDFFLLAKKGVMVSTPTPTALVNAYLFLKNAVFRIVQQSIKKSSPAAAYIETLIKNPGGMQRLYVLDVLKKIAEIDEHSHKSVLESFANFQPRLVFNMIEDPKDAEKAQKLRRSCQQYLGIDLEHLGIMYRDDLQDTALQAGLPIVSYKPKAVLSLAIARIADKLLQCDSEGISDDFLQEDALNQSFAEAEMEADIDFQSKIDYIEDLVQSGALTMGDLLETVKSQQLELSHVRKENMFLKSKLVKAAAQGFKV
jgi:flagellar biosynthesis protein FlhG